MSDIWRQVSVSMNVSEQDDELKHVGHWSRRFRKLECRELDDKLKHVGHLAASFFKLECAWNVTGNDRQGGREQLVQGQSSIEPEM